MARFLIIWFISNLYFMLLNLPILFYYDLKLGIFFTICGNLAVFAALFIEIALHISQLIKTNGKHNNTVL